MHNEAQLWPQQVWISAQSASLAEPKDPRCQNLLGSRELNIDLFDGCRPVHPARSKTQPIYAGYLTHKRWGIHWLKARHEPLVSLETYEKIQERRKGMAKAPARKNLNEDFPMRGFVLCNDCQKPLTSCWSKGRLKTVSIRQRIPEKCGAVFGQEYAPKQPDRAR